MQPWKRDSKLAWVAILLVVLPAASVRLKADDPVAPGMATEPGGDSAEPNDAVPTSFAPPDRSTLMLFGRARLLLEEARYAEVVQCLGAILENPNDFFFRPDPNAASYSSLKSEAQRLLGGMSHQGRELYELQFGPVARRMLQDAAAAGDADGLAEVSRRFFHTQAGYEATLLLGLHHLDQARPMAGALTLQRLRETSPGADRFEPALSLALAACWFRAEMPDKARHALAGLAGFRGESGVEIGGEEVPWFGTDGDSLVWLAGLLGPESTVGKKETNHWTMLHGDPSRNVSTGASRPLLNKRWRVPTTGYPEVEALIQQVRREQVDEDGPLLPGLHPLVVDDVVLMRTTKNLLAVDLPTGKRIWEVPVEDPFEGLLDPAPGTMRSQGPQLQTALRLRMWADATFGTLASDGRLVFSIEDLPLETGLLYRQQVLFNALQPSTATVPMPFNRLAAYDVKSGKLIWHVGGSTEQYGLPLGGAFFLGPPLPLMGNLYVLAEITGEIRLVALGADKGDFLWNQQLAIADRDVVSDPLRRLSGVSPSFADGILVCPTANKAVVALELTTRSLLWGYTYAAEDLPSDQAAMFLASRQERDPDPSGRWLDSSVVLADSHVLVTPVDSDQLHCLSLVDGRLLWKQDREDDCYLACVHDGKAVLVGRERIRALDLRDGRPAWDGREVEIPPGSHPSGTGLYSGKSYYLPLSSAQVLSIDLETGRAEKAFTSRHHDVPGNLVAYRDKIISQRADGVEAYYQLDALRDQVKRRLEDAEDVEALTLQGEILWDDGNLDEAVESFRRAWTLAPSIFRRKALLAALFEGLSSDFSDYRLRTDEIGRLIEEPSEEATLLRLTAVGFAGAAEFGAAIDRYQKLIDLDLLNRGMEQVDDALSVRRDRWIRTQLTALREHAPPDFHEEMDAWIRRRLQAAVDEGTPEAVRRFLEYFDSQPAADEARGELVRHLRASGGLLALELVLKGEQRRSDSPGAARATAELATAFHEAGRAQDAAVYYETLGAQFADVPCRNGQTGRQLREALGPDDQIQRWLAPESPWPVGEVAVEVGGAAQDRAGGVRQLALEFRGNRAPFFSDVTIEYEQTPPGLVARDGYGRKQWQLPLDEFAPQDYFGVGHGVMCVDALDHLLLLSVGDKILAIDTLGAAGDASPRVIWRQDLNLPDVDSIRRQQLRNRLGNAPGGMGGIRFSGSLYPFVDSAEAISEQVICFKRLHQLVGVDPLSGDPLWIREGVRPDSTVFGDQEVVLVVPSEQTTAMVLRASDGQLLGQREIPDERERITPVGRRLLVLRSLGGRSVLRLVDPWKGQDHEDRSAESAEEPPAENDVVWSTRRFDDDASLFLLNDEAVAIFEPNGKFLLVDLADGRKIIDRKLQAEETLTEILVFRWAEQYLLVTNTQQGPVDLSRRNIYGMAGTKINRGHVYAFDREGNPLWPSPALVENYFLPISQPSRLPVLTFACAIQQNRAPGTAQRTPKVAVLCLDKRNGRVVCEEEISDAPNPFQLIGDPEKKTVEIRLPGNVITMTFTDRPLPPVPPTQEARAKKPLPGRSTGTSFLEALRKAVADELSKGVEPADDDPPPPRQDE
jgi:outer membrane protein assembly factor BamB